MESRQSAQIHCGFSVAIAGQHAAPPSHQGKHMAGTPQIFGLGGRVHALAAGVAPLGGRDAGGGVHMIDGHGEGGAVVVGVDLHHLLQPQTGGHFLAHRGANETLGVSGHKVHVLRGSELGGADQVALVLPVRIVNGNDDMSGPEFLQSLLHSAVSLFHVASSLKFVAYQKFQGDAAGPGLFRPGPQQLLHIFANDVRLHVYDISRPFLAQDGDCRRVRNDRDRKTVRFH